MDFLSSGIIAAVAGGVVSYFVSKRLDVKKQMMEMRRVVYSDMNEQLSMFFSTNTNRNQDGFNILLGGLRKLQIWGSDEVVQKFNTLLYALDKKNNTQQDITTILYQETVLEMRRDVLGATDLSTSDIKVIGKIS